MGTKIKICGLMHQEDVTYVNNYKPDYIGFVFARSKRQISKEQAKILASQLDKSIIRVGVFVDQPVEYVASLVKKEIIQAVQLHGNEDNQYIKRLRAILSMNDGYGNKNQTNLCMIIKAIRVRNQEDIVKADEYDCDYLLLDSFSLECEGGNGKTFDWSLIKELKKPFFLAGGLNSKNVCTAISRLMPYGVDASSSLETDGLKDNDKIRTYIKTIREFEKEGGYYE